MRSKRCRTALSRLLATGVAVTGVIFMACAQNNSRFTSQSNDEFAKTIGDKNVQLIDVRTPSEYAAGHIPKAVNIDVQSESFDKQTDALDKTRPVAVYCRSGKRSKVAANKLSAKGFKVFELNGGMLNWNGESIKP